MSALVEVLYPVPDLRRTPLTLLRWWESRRLLYNQVVGTVGMVSLAGAMVLVPGPTPSLAELAPAVAAYAVMANLCYSLGWTVELAARWVWGRKAPDLGPLLFREGLIFATGVTLLPLLLATMARLAWAVALLIGWD